MVIVLFFFFKQKTAYDVRISDWSSDVCSSDLPPPACADPRAGHVRGHVHAAARPAAEVAVGQQRVVGQADGVARDADAFGQLARGRQPLARPQHGAVHGVDELLPELVLQAQRRGRVKGEVELVQRSEEQTSELQSLMRSTYA